jgi:hypothetical protein
MKDAPMPINARIIETRWADPSCLRVVNEAGKVETILPMVEIGRTADYVEYGYVMPERAA